MRNIISLIALVGVALFCQSAQAESYKFKVENNGKLKITQLLVSEDGKKWNQFDIGKGIEAGESATMVWNESSNDQSCDQKVKAGYADGSESESAQFNFCEDNLELEF